MNYLYTGVTYKFPIPKGDVNTILKGAVAIVAVGLNDHAFVQMYLATVDMPDLEIIKGDYYFEISTSGLNPEWTEEKLCEVGLKIKAETNTKVGLQTHGPLEG